MSFNGRCLDAGGLWCTAASAYSTRLGRVELAIMFVCAVAVVVLSITKTLRSISAAWKSHKSDL